MINFEMELEKIILSKIGYDFLKVSNKKIILYGAGSLGKMALNLLLKEKFPPKYIIDNNFEGQIDGIKILNPKSIIKKDKEEYTFIICISSIPYLPIYNFLKEQGCKNIIHFYDFSELYFKNLLGNGWYKFNLTEKDKKNILLVSENLLHDRYSLIHYLQFLWWKIRRIEKIDSDYPILSNRQYFTAPCMPKLNMQESFLDGGSHFGTTTEKFLAIVDFKYNNIWAIEPDKENLSTMKRNFSNISNIKYLPIALSDKKGECNFIDKLGFASKLGESSSTTIETNTIDNLNINPTIIKLHLEGNELKALYGANETIKKSRPILMVLADHNEDGLYNIAFYLIKLIEYKIYFYLHDYCGNSAVFYAIPKERF